MVEYFSKGLEAQPMDFFRFPRGWKRSRWIFFAFQGVGSAADGFFSLFKGLEMQLVAFFGFPRGWKRIFSLFPPVQALGWAGNRFLRVRGVVTGQQSLP
ncbi:hypothetical protein [Hallella seregens]|uniref:hypothetical protein n=1 Tax=Hallella seregens TaxID=52229 RepID=UPI000484FFFF|nr:hypothetical protein [Hallella seregens]